jgi:hypothetical protein
MCFPGAASKLDNIAAMTPRDGEGDREAQELGYMKCRMRCV